MFLCLCGTKSLLSGYFKEAIGRNTYPANKLLGEPSKLKSAETWEKFPSGNDPPAPYQTWDFFELGNFLKWNDPPPLNGTWDFF